MVRVESMSYRSLLCFVQCHLSLHASKLGKAIQETKLPGTATWENYLVPKESSLWSQMVWLDQDSFIVIMMGTEIIHSCTHWETRTKRLQWIVAFYISSEVRKKALKAGCLLWSSLIHKHPIVNSCMPHQMCRTSSPQPLCFDGKPGEGHK